MDSALRARLIELQIAVEEPDAVGMYILEEARIRGIKTMQYGAEEGGHDLSEDGGAEEECIQAALSGILVHIKKWFMVIRKVQYAVKA